MMTKASLGIMALLPVLLCALAAPGQEAWAAEKKPVAIVEGYPAFDYPLLEFVLRRQRMPVERFEKQWLETREYPNYAMVVIVGDLARAGIQHNKYDAGDLKNVAEYLASGGRLMLMRGNTNVFYGTPEGRAFLEKFTGTALAARGEKPELTVLKPDHPWVRHLDKAKAETWMAESAAAPIIAPKAERLLGADTRWALLCRIPAGKGEIIYFGWDISRDLPGGRSPSTPEKEERYESQMKILMAAIADLFPPKER